MGKKDGGAKAQAAPAARADAAGPVEQKSNGGNKPVHEVRLGRIRASVWHNTNSKQESWYSVVLTRGYKDGQGQWKNSHSLGLDDLLVAGEVLRLAALWVYRERQGENKASVAAANGAAAQEGVGSSDIPF